MARRGRSLRNAQSQMLLDLSLRSGSQCRHHRHTHTRTHAHTHTRTHTQHSNPPQPPTVVVLCCSHSERDRLRPPGRHPEPGRPVLLPPETPELWTGLQGAGEVLSLLHTRPSRCRRWDAPGPPRPGGGLPPTEGTIHICHIDCLTIVSLIFNP